VDTITAAGSDAYTAALQVYEYAQAADVAGPLESLMAEMRERFAEQAAAQEVAAAMEE